MLPEYMVSILPLLVLLGSLKYEKFKERLINKYGQVNPKKLFTYILLLYIITSPFSLEHLKYMIEHRTFVLNPYEMIQLEYQINKLPGSKILSSWDAYSIFSNKSASIKNDYTSIQIVDYVDETTIKKYNLREPKEYEIMIKSREPDVIVYDRNNPLYLTGLETLIAQNYKKAFEYKYIVVYRKM
jgi:hypothetical protein